VTTHAVKVFTREAAIPLQAQFHIRARPSALTVRRQNVSTTATIAAMRSTLISRAAMQAQAWRHFAEPLRRGKNRNKKKGNQLLTEWKSCGKVILFDVIQTDTAKQSVHSHPMAIGLIGVYNSDFIS
jgi:Dihydroorotase